MANNIKVSFVGSGNVAWHLAPELDNTGFTVCEVYSRNRRNAESLVSRLYQAEVKENLDFSTSQSQLFVIAVSDDAIENIALEIMLPDNAVLAHTSGSRALSALGYAATDKIGVFYPLQTFSKGKGVDFSEIPILIESEDKETGKLLTTIATKISKTVRTVKSEDRKALHVAAVFACNFTNHMFKAAEDILEGKGLNFDLLKPLIVETINKSLKLGPAKAQTGPARRGDMDILEKHVQYLDDDHGYQEIYKVITQHILDTYH